MKPSFAFGWGCLGACLPVFLRFFQVLDAGKALPNLNWPLYGVFVAVYAVLAGLFTVAWKPDSAYKAIWVGASFQALVATMVQTIPPHP